MENATWVCEIDELMELKIMKLKDLIKKINGEVAIYINRKKPSDNLPEEMLEAEIVKIEIETKNADDSDDLESLGYSFEVGV